MIINYKNLEENKVKKREKKVLKIKTYKIGVNISENDLNTKVRKAEKDMEKGHDVKFHVMIRGRQSKLMSKKDIEKMLNSITEDYKKINVWSKGDNYFALVRKK